MKKYVMKIVLWAAVLALALSLAACGSSTDSRSAGADGSSAADSQSESASSSLPISKPEKKETTLEELCSDPTVKSTFDRMIAQLADESMSLEYEVKENTFTYIYTYTDTTVDYSGIGDLLTAELERQGNQFVNTAKNFDDEVGRENACTVVVRYLDPDGNVLAERAYTAADEFDTSLEDLENESYETLEDYFANPTVKASMDTMIAGMEEEGMKVTLDVQGNVFAVTIQITDASLIDENTGSALLAGLEEQAETYSQQAGQFDTAVGEKGACTVIMRYTDPDGNVLAEKEFKAE